MIKNIETLWISHEPLVVGNWIVLVNKKIAYPKGFFILVGPSCMAAIPPNWYKSKID